MEITVREALDGSALPMAARRDTRGPSTIKEIIAAGDFHESGSSHRKTIRRLRGLKPFLRVIPILPNACERGEDLLHR